MWHLISLRLTKSWQTFETTTSRAAQIAPTVSITNPADGALVHRLDRAVHL